MTKKERVLMQQHLRHLGVLGLKANVKHHKVVDTISTHSKELLKMYKVEKKKNEQLTIQLEAGQFQIEDLTKENLDQMWNLAKLEEKNIKLEKELTESQQVESDVAHYEKKIKKFLKKESVDN